MAETSTVVFAVLSVVAFVGIRWYLNSTSNATSTVGQSRPANDRARSSREVTQDMIQVVQVIAPALEEAQIRHDLEQTGSVEATIEKYLSTGTLPSPSSRNSATAADPAVGEKEKDRSLLSKYNIDPEQSTLEDDTRVTWASSKEERQANLRKQQEQMILRARQRMLSRPTNS